MADVKLKPEVKQLWLDALRSGEYQQANATLKQTWTAHPSQPEAKEGYCCLGVLCELAVKAGVIPPAIPYGEGDPKQQDGTWLYGSENPDYAYLPVEVRRWAFRDTDSFYDTGNPIIGPEGDRNPLSVWNDERAAGFADIADLIERYL